jgi:hypothetical protein
LDTWMDAIDIELISSMGISEKDWV